MLGHFHLVAFPFQAYAEGIPGVVVVVDYKDCLCRPCHCVASGEGEGADLVKGMDRVTAQPPPGRFSTETEPL